MNEIYNFITANIYLYICIIISLLILTTILLIICTNQKNRKRIKDDFIEAEKLEAEIEKKDDTPNVLEDILKKMQEDMEVKPEDVVRKFEEEQEEKAIISYQELVDNVKSGKIEVIDDEQTDVNFVENLVNEDEQIIENEILEEEHSVTPDMVKEAIESISTSSVKEVPKKFKQSEFISPIYGIMDNKLEYPTVKKNVIQNNTLDIMSTNNYDKLTEEIKKQEEFLETLKAFKNNL